MSGNHDQGALLETLADRANHPFGDVQGVSGRVMQHFSFAGQEAARNLLVKARRALGSEDLDPAGGYVDRAVRLPFDDHEGAAPAALEAHMALFCAVTDAAEQAAEDDQRWLDAALLVLDHADERAACDLRDVLVAIDQDYTLSAHERRRIRSAIATVPDRAELRDLQLCPTELRAHILSTLRALADYEATLRTLGD